MSQTPVVDAVMVLLLWSAAVYRVHLSSRTRKTVWRTAFTTTVVSVAAGATLSVYGYAVVDRPTGVANLAFLLTHLALVVTGASTSIYVATLRRTAFPPGTVRWRIAAAGAVWVVQIASWTLAPIHAQEMADFSAVWDNLSVCLFNVTFVLVIVSTASETSWFCLTQARSRDDLTRTISLTLTGVACAAGAGVFVVGGAAVIARYATDADVTTATAFFNGSYPYIMVVLALGTLTLWVGPPVIDFVSHYRRWRLLKPLWLDLIDSTPEVHLDIPLVGGPRQRIHLRVQRAIVEIHDALRVTPVSLPPDATLEELAHALHTPGGGHAAADVLNRVGTTDDDITRLLKLARNYSRSPA